MYFATKPEMIVSETHLKLILVRLVYEMISLRLFWTTGTILENGEAFYALIKIPPTRFSAHQVAYSPDCYDHAAASAD
jgi:hypothetical protein